MQTTVVELHAVLHYATDRGSLTDEDVEALRLRVAEAFRDEFDRMTLVGKDLANCTDCSVGVAVAPGVP